jgi:hypothetical protein
MSTDYPNPEDLRALARALPSPAPGRAQVAKVRERVLAQATIARRRDRLRSGAFVGLALAAGAVLAIGLRGPSVEGPVARYHGTITAWSGARFTRASAAPDELVVLQTGTIHVEVSRLSQGERFRVRAGDGEVEVRGTAFDVTVDDGHMERVAVEHGRVEVRRPGAAGAVLGAGQHWTMAQREGAVGMPPDDAPPAAAPPAAVAPTRRKSGVARAPEPVPEPAHEPDVASRLIVPPPSPSMVVPPRATAPNDSPRAVDTTRVPASSEHDEERRERRDERRERYDQRRLR